MPRPKRAKGTITRIQIRITDDEKITLLIQADKAGLTLSEYVRRCSLNKRIQSHVSDKAIGRLRKQLGSIDEGINIVKEALQKKPTESRLRDLLISFLNDKGEHDAALTVAIEGARLDPTSWRIQRWLARLRQHGQEVVNAVRGNYDAAIRHHKGDVGVLVEYASYLFRKLLLGDASRTRRCSNRFLHDSAIPSPSPTPEYPSMAGCFRSRPRPPRSKPHSGDGRSWAAHHRDRQPLRVIASCL